MRSGPLVRVLLGAVMLMAVTLAIGRPTVFSDTDDYYAQGRDVATLFQTWVRTGKPPIDLSEAHYRLTDPDAADEEPTHNQDGARSVYYGLFLYLAQAAGTLWLLAGVQSLLAAGVVQALWRHVRPDGRGYLAAMAVLALGSTLPVFTAFAMPDLFAGFAAATTVLALVYGEGRSRWRWAALWLLLAASLNFHGSNLLTTLVISAVALTGLGLARTDGRRLVGRAVFVASAVAAAVLAAKAYALFVKMRTGDELSRPPFLTARVLADGPGRAYLGRHCGLGNTRFQVCAFRKLPLDNTEDILWADEPELGIFNSQEYPVRLKLVRQDAAFALAAVREQPGRELTAALRNWGDQLAATDLEEPLRDPGYYVADPYWRTTNLPRLIQDTGRCDPHRGTCALRAPRRGMALWVTGLALGALVASAVLGARLLRRGPKDEAGMTGAAAGLLILAVGVNAAVCGMLSGPFARYEMRMLWLIPLAAMMLWAQWRKPPSAMR